MAKRALIVIDLQNDHFPGGKWSLSGVEAAAANAARLIAAFMAALGFAYATLLSTEEFLGKVAVAA